MSQEAAEKPASTPDEAPEPRKKPRLTEEGAYITLVVEPVYQDSLEEKDVMHFKLDVLPPFVTRASYFVISGDEDEDTNDSSTEPDKDIARLTDDLVQLTEKELLEKWNAEKTEVVPLGAPHVIIVNSWPFQG